LSYDYIATALQAQGEQIPAYMDSVPILEDLQGKTQTLANIPRHTLWKDTISWIRLGDYKYSGTGINDHNGFYDIYSDTRYNVQEDDSATPPPLSVVNELDSILNDFIADVTDPLNQESYFDNN